MDDNSPVGCLLSLFYYKLKWALICILLFIVSVFLVFLFRKEPPPLPPIDKSPENVSKEVKKFLTNYKDQLLETKATIEMFKIPYPIHFYDRHLYVMINGFDYNVEKDYNQLYNFLTVNHQPKYGIYFEIRDYPDLTLYRGIDSLDFRLASYLCYSELPINELQNYKYGIKVFSKDEIPNVENSYFWEMEDNWYIYEPKDKPFIDDNFVNVATYFAQIYDTLDIIKNELIRVNLRSFDSIAFKNHFIFINHFQRNDKIHLFERAKKEYNINAPNDSLVVLSDIPTCLWRYEYDDYKKYLYHKTTLLDSLFDKKMAPFNIIYCKNFIIFNTQVSDIQFIYSELSQQSIEQSIDKKIYKLRDNWYYTCEKKQWAF